tara:strand:- start:92 stop:715 length:624 start_codon:yes stop_codon:yes gene_type:complete
MSKLKNTLSKDAFWQVNKAVAKELKSIEASVLLSELYFLHKQHPTKEYVFINQDRLQQNCCLTLNGLRSAMKVLGEAGLVDVVKKGMPAINHYRVVDTAVSNLLDNYSDYDANKSAEKQLTSDQPANKSSVSISTSDQADSAHINKVITKKVKPNKEVIKYSNSTNKPIGKDLVLDKSSIDIKYINSVPENMLTKDQITIKSNHFFG